MHRAAGLFCCRVVALLALASTAHAADAQRPAAGGAKAAPVVPRKTREELVREWDINKDGKIEIGEAELAASRMRLERAKMRLNTGIDPVTGQLRGEPDPGEQVEDDREPFADPDADPFAEPAGEEGETKQPEKKPAPRNGTSGTPPAAGAARFPTQRPLPFTGGVRAGAQAARPGYGAAPPTSLNAGRPRDATAGGRAAGVAGREPAMPGGQPAAAPNRPRGGLLPRPPLTPPARSRDLYDPY